MKLLKQVGPCMASHGITGGGHNEIGGGGGGGGKGGGEMVEDSGCNPKGGMWQHWNSWQEGERCD
jgi:hypothetical protein